MTDNTVSVFPFLPLSNLCQGRDLVRHPWRHFFFFDNLAVQCWYIETFRKVSSLFYFILKHHLHIWMQKFVRAYTSLDTLHSVSCSELHKKINIILSWCALNLKLYSQKIASLVPPAAGTAKAHWWCRVLCWLNCCFYCFCPDYANM